MKITLSSLPGAGSSTVARLLAKKLNIQRIDAGEVWDEIAKEHHLDIIQLGYLAEKDESIDLKLDKEMLSYAKDDKNLILEGRLCSWLCHQNKIPAFKIWLKCPLKIRVKRVSQREKVNFKKTFKETKRRQESEEKRYKKYYHIDINDLSIYDLVIDSSKMTPDKIVGCILEKIQLVNSQ